MCVQHVIRVIGLSLVFCLGRVNASSFELWEQDTAGAGDYHAGAAVDTSSGGVASYNPAALSFLDHKQSQIVAGGSYVPVRLGFKGTLKFMGNHNVDERISSNNFIPNLHYVRPLGESWVSSLSLTVPFGAAAVYPDADSRFFSGGSSEHEHVLGFVATSTELQVLDFSPHIAYAANEWLSVGFGLDGLTGVAKFDQNAIDQIAITSPDDETIRNNVHLKGYGFGWNAGVYMNIHSDTALGIGYRSGVTLHAKGFNRLELSSRPAVQTRIKTNLPLPSVLYLSMKHKISQSFSVFSSFDYTNWHVLKSLSFHNMVNPLNSNQRITVTNLYHYNSVWNVALGAHWQIRQNWMLKFGGGYDWTPVRDQYRDVRLPDVNHWVTAVGLHVKPWKSVMVDLAWEHVIPAHKALIDHRGPIIIKPDGSAYPSPYHTKGEGFMQVNVFSMSMTYLL